MYIKSNLAKQIYRGIYVVICAFAIIGNYITTAQMNGNMKLVMAYYTVITNVICLGYFGYLFVRGFIPNMKNKEENPLVKGLVVMSIALTGIGYHALLNGFMGGSGMDNSALLNIVNLCLHTIVPAMAIFDYFFFTRKGQYRWYYPLVWTVVPAIYCVFVFIRAALSSETFYGFVSIDGELAHTLYPYPFVDPQFMGGPGYVFLAILGLVVMYIGLGYLALWLDKVFVKMCKNSPDSFDVSTIDVNDADAIVTHESVTIDSDNASIEIETTKIVDIDSDK